MRPITPRVAAVLVLVCFQWLITAQEPPRLELVLQMGIGPGTWGNGQGSMSGDGKVVVTIHRTVAIQWDPRTGKKLRTLKGHTDTILSMALSPDGKLLLTGSSDKAAILWDLTSGKRRQTFRDNLPAEAAGAFGQQPREGSAYAVALSADGKRVVIGSWKTASVWDGTNGKKLHTLEGFKHWVTGLAISPDGKHVVSAPEGGGLAILWEAAGGRILRTFDKVRPRMALSRDGKQVLMAGPEETVVLRETQTGKVVQTFKGHKLWVASVALSGDGKHVLTGSADNTAVLWDARTGKAVRTFRGHAALVRSVALSADGARALTVCENNTAFLWDTANGEKLHTFREHADSVNGVALSGDGKSLAVAGPGVSVWGLADGKKIGTFRGTKANFESVALSGDGKHVIAGSRSQEAVLWDTKSGKPVGTFPGFDGYWRYPVNVAFTNDDRSVIIAAGETADVRSATTGKSLQTFRHNKTRDVRILDMALSGDGKRLLLGASDRTASLWEMASGKQLQTFTGHTGLVYSVALNRDGTLVLTGASPEDRTAILWDAATGRQRHAFERHRSAIYRVALSADGKHAVTPSHTRAILWATAKGEKLRDFEGHTHAVKNLILSADGKHLWTTSTDRSIRLWDTATGKERCRIYSLNMSDDWLVVTPDGRFDGSSNAWRFVAYREPGTLKLLEDDATRKRFHRPGLLAQVLKRGK